MDKHASRVLPTWRGFPTGCLTSAYHGVVLWHGKLLSTVITKQVYERTSQALHWLIGVSSSLGVGVSCD